MTKKSNENEQWKLLVLILKEVAEQKGITHQSIADKTGLIRSNVSRFFGLSYTPSLSMFLLIAKAIGVNFFFEDKESKSDLNLAFEKAMEKMFRRPESFKKN